jgi:hypothetical protein
MYFFEKGSLSEPEHCFTEPEFTKAADEREPTTQINDDSKEFALEREEKSDEDIDGPAAGTDSSKNDGHWAFVEDGISQTEVESDPEERTETTNCNVHRPLEAENSHGFQLEDSSIGKVHVI